VYIKEIRLENVRGFHDSRDVSLDLTRPDGSFAGWTVLAGRNGSGKTSLLRAVALAIGGPCLREWRRAVRRQAAPDAAELLHTIHEQPCADVCQAMLRQVEQPGAAVVFAQVPDIVELLRDQQVRRVLLLTAG
jgi:recombinational DNA repair ATPase RecF